MPKVDYKEELSKYTPLQIDTAISFVEKTYQEIFFPVECFQTECKSCNYALCCNILTDVYFSLIKQTGKKGR